MSMARLWRDQGKRDEAHDLLAPLYGWFAEGSLGRSTFWRLRCSSESVNQLSSVPWPCACQQFIEEQRALPLSPDGRIHRCVEHGYVDDAVYTRCFIVPPKTM
jgi:hypothetical protein